MSYKETLLIDSITSIRRNPQRIIPELSSLSNETNGRSDTFFYVVGGGSLIDPETRRSVRDFIDSKSDLGKTEAKFLARLETSVSQKDEGVFVWISPPYHGRYPCSKAIFYKISYTWDGQKVVDNSAILFDADAKTSLALAEELTGEVFINPEELRETPLFFNDAEGATQKVLSVISRRFDVQLIKPENDIEQKAKSYAAMIAEEISEEIIVKHMLRTGFLGLHSTSCPPTFLEFTFGVSLGKYVENCGKCRVHIGKPITKGFRCPNCGGTYEGC